MSGVDPPKLYPGLGNDAMQFRLQEIAKIRSQLEDFFEEHGAIARKQEKKVNKCREVAGWLGSIGTAVSVAGGTVGATGVGVIPGGVLLGVGAVLGAGSVVALKMEPKLSKKATTHEKLAALTEGKLFSLREKISKALIDGKVSDEEFNLFTDEMRKFEMQRREILMGGLAQTKKPKNGDSKMELVNDFAKYLSMRRKGSP